MPTAPADDPARGSTGRWASLRARLHRFDDAPLVDVGLRIYRRDREIVGSVVGSAIAMRLFLFFVPLLLLVVGFVGVVASFVEPDINETTGLSGGLAAQIDTALDQTARTRWVAVALGVWGSATAGYGLSKVMVAASALAWRLPERPRASPRVIGAFVGLIVGIGLVAAIVNRVRAELGLGVASVSFLAALVVYLVAWLAVAMLLPRATSDVGALLPGAVLVAVTLTAMQGLSQLYLPDRMSRASELYGAFGATVVTLGWFFFLGRAIVLSMVLDAVIHERFGRISNFVFAWPVLRTLARRSSFVRRVFRIDLPVPGGRSD